MGMHVNVSERPHAVREKIRYRDFSRRRQAGSAILMILTPDAARFLVWRGPTVLAICQLRGSVQTAVVTLQLTHRAMYLGSLHVVRHSRCMAMMQMRSLSG